jgi:hypothetical protein
MKTLKTFSNLAEAGFAQSLLEAAGLHPSLADEQTGGSYSPIAVLGMRLQVDESEYEHALRVLAEGLDAEPSASETGPSPMAGMATDPRAGGRIPWAVFASVIVGFIVICFVVGDKMRTRNRRLSTNTAGEDVQTRDNNHDGKPDQSWFYSSGKLIRYEADRDFDGRIDEWGVYGDDSSLVRTEVDRNKDGKPDHWYDYRGGLCVASRVDTDLNGIPDYFGTFKDDIFIEGDMRPNASSITTRRQFYLNEFLHEEWVDENEDGKFDYRIEYDPFGKPSGHLPMAETK